MGNRYIVNLDVAKKQAYIFSSNSLKEIVGGSYAIKFLSEFLGKKIIERVCEDPRSGTYFGENNLEGCVLFDKGGQSMYIFDSESTCDAFIETFHTYAFRMFPGIHYHLVKTSFDMTKEKLTDVLSASNRELFKQKNHCGQLGTLSFGKTERCKSTGGIAGYMVETEDNNKKSTYSADAYLRQLYYSITDPFTGLSKEESDIKRTLQNNIYCQENFEDRELDVIAKWFAEFFPLVCEEKGFGDASTRAQFTNDIDAFMSDEGNKFYAVITMDGNHMGDFIRGLPKYRLTAFENQQTAGETLEAVNFSCILEQQAVSDCIHTAFKSALDQTREALVERDTEERTLFPYRVLISSGDDISVLVGAAQYLEFLNSFTEQFQQGKTSALFGVGHVRDAQLTKHLDDIATFFNSAPHKNDYRKDPIAKKTLHFAIGTVLIDSKYPLYRAVAAAEHLQSLCKRKLAHLNLYYENQLGKTVKSDEKADATLMAFKLYRGDIENTKDSDKEVAIYQLSSSSVFGTVYPQFLLAAAEEKTSEFSHFESLQNVVQELGGDLKGKSSVVKLLAAFTKGEKAATAYLKTHELSALKTASEVSVESRYPVIRDAVTLNSLKERKRV
ncbi:hypothetical protein ACR6HW_08780 [Fusibacter sp. JL298sf-3]